MMVTMDKAGRIVVPKEIRERLNFTPDSVLELRVDGESLVIVPERRRGRRIVEVDGWPVIEAVPGLSVTDADVQRWRDDGQR
ncbi:MAG: AbrB/MazE/SpoVT family DNA-binding domain-containing protein [Propionibacteriaceae bacterium]|nr:AbrB/MazE/SpoVT family DNA-binding domain-containing protein [Propionibacteriaceae bacterium]